MRTAVTTDTGGLDTIEIRDVPKPSVGPDEVLVDVKASAVNFVDIWIRKGHEGDTPRITGVDVAGVISEVGENVTDRAVGDHVVLYWNTNYCGVCEYCLNGEITMCLDYGGLGITRDGGHAEFVAVDSKFAVPISDDIPLEEAAAFPTGFGTAWRALITRGRLEPGERVLVLGASGSVGHAAVQVAKDAGAVVYACTSADWKAEKLEELGVDEVVDYTDVDFDSAVRDLTDGRGVDIVLDSIGGDPYKKAVRSLTRGGRLVTIGATVGDADQAMLTHIFWKQLEVIGSTGCTLGEFYDVLDRYTAGVYSPVVDSVISLDELPDAQQKLQDRGVFGKIIVTP